MGVAVADREYTRRLAQCLSWVSRFLKWVGVGSLLGMACLGTAHVLSRWLFGHPFFGTPEILEFLNVALVSCAILYADDENAHLSVDVAFNALPVQLQRVIKVCTDGVSSGLCFLFSWTIYNLAENVRRSHEVSLTLEIHYHVFIYGVALCFALWGVHFLVDIFVSKR